MSASRTKNQDDVSNGVKRSVQLIVFAPLNADRDDEDKLIYMVCPSSLRVVEVVEKFDDEAITYLSTLSRSKVKTEKPAKDFMDDLSSQFDGEIEIAGESSTFEDEIDEMVDSSEVTSMKSQADSLDEDIVAFASQKLDDIFPDDDDAPRVKGDPQVDMDTALSMLDAEDDDDNLESILGMDDFGDSDGLPEL